MSVLTFPLGRLVITPSALDAVPCIEIEAALLRHSKKDWGDLSDDDRKVNDDALATGERVVSAYVAASGTRFWIITEANRSATTILLPDDY